MYNKHELTLAYNSRNEYYDEMKLQFDYARENLESLMRIVNIDTSYASRAGGAANETISTTMLSKFFELLTKLLYVGIFAIIFLLIFRQYGGKNMLE